ncbi:MAG TPA: aldehyde dehydrogenase family protein, partial [Nocardioides sp.]
MSSKEITIAQPVNYIADEWSECTTVDDAWNLDPNTLEPVHRTVSTPLDDVERALRQAERTYDVGRWDEEARHERAEMLERVAELLESRTEDIARTDALTSGTPISATRTVASFLPYRIR